MKTIFLGLMIVATVLSAKAQNASQVQDNILVILKFRGESEFKDSQGEGVPCEAEVAYENGKLRYIRTLTNTDYQFGALTKGGFKAFAKVVSAMDKEDGDSQVDTGLDAETAGALNNLKDMANYFPLTEDEMRIVAHAPEDSEEKDVDFSTSNSRGKFIVKGAIRGKGLKRFTPFGMKETAEVRYSNKNPEQVSSVSLEKVDSSLMKTTEKGSCINLIPDGSYSQKASVLAKKSEFAKYRYDGI
jgi:hypothetical protein